MAALAPVLVPAQAAAADDNEPVEPPTTLDIILSVTSVDDCIQQIELPIHRNVLNAVVTFEGVDNRDRLLAGEQELLTDEMILRVFTSMATRLKQLESLRLEWNIVSANFFEVPPLLPLSVLEYTVQHFTSLKSLSLYRVKLAGASYTQLTNLARHNSTLKTVRIEFCAPVLGSPNLDAIVQAMSQLTQLQDLEVIGFQGDPTRGCTSTSLQTLGRAPYLKTLKLWGGILQSEDPRAVTQMARGLEATTSMTDLEVGLFTLDLESSQALASLLKANTSLHRIWLDVNNSLERELVEPLAQAMKDNTNIKSFNLVSTTKARVSEDVLQLFVNMTKVNMNLRHCTIRGCSTTLFNDTNEENNEEEQESSTITACRDKMQFYLKLNRVGRKQLMANCRRRYKWLSTLICENDNTSVIFYLLKRNPTFITHCVRWGATKRKHVVVVATSEQQPQQEESTPPRKRLKPSHLARTVTPP